MHISYECCNKRIDNTILKVDLQIIKTANKK